MRSGLAQVELPGRFQIVPGQPVVVLDVGHNPHAVATLAVNLDAMGFYPRTRAVMGAMADKDIPGMLRLLAPIVDAWHFTDLPLPRAATGQRLAEHWRATMPASPAAVSTHADPASALQSALAAADPADRIVVFGSFLTVGGVMASGLPRTSAPHTPPAPRAPFP